jgi:hypothetical protein
LFPNKGSGIIISEMKDLSEYIVKQDGAFYIDLWDVDTGEPVFEVGEVFSFEYKGVTYKGMAQGNEDWDDEEMVPVLLVKN